jgi:hypothetical protein
MVSACNSQEAQLPKSQDSPAQIAPVAAPSQVSSAWTVRLVVSGGFAGLAREIAVNGATGRVTLTDQKTGERDDQPLSDPDRVEITQLVQTLPKVLSNRVNNDCNDCFSFDLSVSRDGVVQNARLESLNLSDAEYGPLIAKLFALKSRDDKPPK